MQNVKRKISVIIGTRPEAIKMAPIVDVLRKNSDLWNCEVISTAQHRGLLDQVLDTFQIPVTCDLNIMKEGQTLGHVTERAVQGLGRVFEESRPDMVLVQGDTTTTFCGALAAFYQQIPIGHVEAGLRTDQKYSPYPEEMNRRLTTRLSDLHFVPTEKAEHNLLKEGVGRESILITGNTVIDALLSTAGKESQNTLSVLQTIAFSENHKLILLTMHRRESFGKPIENVFRSISKLAAEYPDVHFVYPVHPNPNVKNMADRILGKIGNIRLIEPLDYLSFAFLLRKSYLVITDSGGVQEEAPTLGVPVLVTREVTERPEAVEAGAALLVGTDPNRVYTEVKKLLEDNNHRKRMSHGVNPYGDGRASTRIESCLRKFFGYDYKAVDIQPFLWKAPQELSANP